MTRTRLTAAILTSFGYDHRPPPEATITLDTRVLLRDPHIDLSLRALTGRHPAVRRRVLATPGAAALVRSTAAAVVELLRTAGDPAGLRVDVAVGCVGGRHRSVVLVDALGSVLEDLGLGVEVAHLDVGRPVLVPRPGGVGRFVRVHR